LDLDLLTIKAIIIQLINAIVQNEEKLKTPIKINIFHLVASGNSPNMEIGTITPTKIDKASVTLKDPKRVFPLFTLYLPFHSVLTFFPLISSSFSLSKNPSLLSFNRDIPHIFTILDI
jgi:hypothetical protein